MYSNGGVLNGPLPGPTSANGVWSLTEIAAAQRNHIWPTEKDASFANVVVLMPLDGPAGTEAFTNYGTLTTAVVNADAANRALLSTAQSKFGIPGVRASFLNNTSGKVQTGGSGLSGLAFSTSDFTIEFHLYVTSLAGAFNNLLDMRPNGTNGLTVLIDVNNNGAAGLWVNSAYRIQSANSVIATNTWYHIAVSKVSGSTKMFVDGSQVGSTYTDSNTYANAALTLMGGGAGTNRTPGYMQNVRITKGTGRYSSGFTAPAAPYPMY